MQTATLLDLAPSPGALTGSEVVETVIGGQSVTVTSQQVADVAVNALASTIAGKVNTADLSNTVDAAKGAALTGWDGNQLSEQMDLSKKLANYTALRNYSGRATIVNITNSRLAGDFYLDLTDTTTADNGGTTIIDALGRRWKREFCDEVLARWFGAVGSGAVSDATACNAAIAFASANNLPCVFTQGTYLLGNSESLQVNVLGTQIEARGRVAIVNQVTASALGAPLISVDADLVSIKGIRFNGGRAQAFDSKSTANEGRFSLLAYGNTTRRGLKLLNCTFEDCRGKGILWNAHDVVMQFCTLQRIGKYVGDITPIDSAFTNWVLPGTPDNVVVTDNIFEYIGMFGSALKNVSNAVFERNTYRHMSGIGAGFQGCPGARVDKNKTSYTFNSGIDLQQCAKPAVTKNDLTSCGYGNIDAITLGPRMYQAIFVGDDSTTNSTGDSLSVGGEVSGNTIQGSYVAGGATSVTEDQTGCGITLVSTTGLKVFGNTINGIGDRSVTTLIVDGKDGVGIKAANNNIGLQCSENTIFDTKSDGVMLGIGDLLGTIASKNTITRHGRHGINVATTSRIDVAEINDNVILNGTNTQSLAVAADIYVGISAGWLAGLTLSGNKCFNTARNSIANAGATVYTTHGIYFKKLGSFAGFGSTLVKDNLSNGHLTKEIAFSDVFTINSKARYFNCFSNNRDGMTDNGTGIIYDIPNFPDIAIEFVAAAAPTSGQFAQGSVCWYPFPTGGDYVGAKCIVSGNPGTWRKFGLISAVPG